MAKINLLPWREALRAEKKKEFITLICVVLVAAVITAFGWDRMLSSQIETQNDRNSLLKSEITRLEKQVAGSYGGNSGVAGQPAGNSQNLR